MPNLSHRDWVDGRHWAVAFRCDRCGEMRYELFDHDDGSEGNLQCVDVPEGWHYTLWMMLCPECHTSFRNWMGECVGKNN